MTSLSKPFRSLITWFLISDLVERKIHHFVERIQKYFSFRKYNKCAKNIVQKYQRMDIPFQFLSPF